MELLSADKSKTSTQPFFLEKGWFINTLAFVIIGLSATILIVLICMTAAHLEPKDGKPDVAFSNIKELLTILLPLTGTWMGTILPFYFSKENFESANQRVNELVEKIQTPETNLKPVNVADIMLKPDNSSLLILQDMEEFKTLLLSDLMKKMTESHSERMPVLKANSLNFIYLIYRTTIERFMVGINDGTIHLLNATGGENPIALNALTVADMLASDFKLIKDIDNVSQKDFFLPVNSSIGQVKKLMNDNPICQDVFITQNGRLDEAVLGWITNNLILEKADIGRTSKK